MSGNSGDSLWDAEPSGVLAAGTRLGKYEIRRLLGAGGMGAVYEANHVEIGKRVAIKVLGPELAAAPGARVRFLREAQLTSKMSHPNIVDVNDMGNEDGRAFIVMEFLAGEDLAQRLAGTGPMAPDVLVDIMLPVCSAVAEAHRMGITHRDLKPQNIFLSEGPRGMEPKVLDFGISKAADTNPGTLTGTGMIGTPFYFAPEQIIDARSAGPASDQYALGVILYECLTGRLPYESDSIFLVFQSIVAGNAVPPRQLRPQIPPELEALVLRAMHLQPKARFGSAAELGRALLPFASARQRAFWEHGFADRSLAGGSQPRREPVAVSPSSRPGGLPATTPMPRTPLPAGVRTPPAGGTVPLSAPSDLRRPPSIAAADFDTDIRLTGGSNRKVILAVVAALIAGGAVAAYWLTQAAPIARRPAELQTVEVAPPAPTRRPTPAALPEVEPPPSPPRPVVPPTKQAEPPGPSHPKLVSTPLPHPTRPAHPKHVTPAAAGSAPVLNPNAAPVVD